MNKKILSYSIQPFVLTSSFVHITHFSASVVPLHWLSLNFNIPSSARLSSTKKPGRQTYPFSVPRNAIYLTSNTFHYSLHLPLNTSILTVPRNANMCTHTQKLSHEPPDIHIPEYIGSKSSLHD